MKKYTIHLSNKQVVLIDEDDFKKFSEVAPTGNLVKLKQAIVNPSFVMAIIPVKETTQKKVEGYVSEETGNFVITKEEEAIPELADEFNDKLLLD